MIQSVIEDKVAACFTTDQPQFTAFLTLEETDEAVRALTYSGVYFELWGGYEQAERKMIGITVSATKLAFPIGALCGRWDKFGEIGHRDILGAVMASGIERRCVGDIITDTANRRFYLFAQAHMTRFITEHVTSIGRCSIVWKPADDLTALPAAVFERRRVSVSSLRVDCVLSAALGLSRTACQTLIAQKKVFVDHRTVGKPTLPLAEGSTVTVRGSGKFILEEIGGLSKKGKTYILLKLYT